MKRILVIAVAAQGCAALSASAQMLSPVAMRQQPAAFALVESETTRSDTLPRSPRQVSIVHVIVGGALGAGIGMIAGSAAGAATASGCHGEYCGLGQAIAGFVLGESLGLAVGTHLAARSTDHEKILLTTLTAASIAVGGALLGAALAPSGLGSVMIPVTPALQLAAAYAIETGK